MMMDWASLWGKGMDNNYERAQVQKKNLSQEAINKLIYDALSSDQGLAALSSGENLSGGFRSSSKTLMAQDMMTKLVGELANVLAETTQTDVKTTKEGRAISKFGDFGDKHNIFNGGNFGDPGDIEGVSKETVICTELVRQGLLCPVLYRSVGGPYKQVSYFTWRGYHVWATKVVPWMQKSETLSHALLPIVRSRYLLLTGNPGIHFLGRVTQLCEIPCWMLGCVLAHVAHFKELTSAKSGQSA